MLHNILPVLLSKVISLLQATTLRERYYLQQQRIEILETAIEDIGRINAGNNKLIDGIVKHSLGAKKGD
jgi:hypothetical protein